MSVQAQRSLDATLVALSDPTRRAILARLAGGEATVNELAEPFTLSQPAISRHVKVLAEAGLILQRVEGAKRPCRLAPGALSELDEYLGMLRKALERNYGRLDRLLASQRRKDSRS
ncbi:MAG: winged helix-turn-helix transcriptional regulator [Polyangiaceae bacterium]|nr:winged helix-turn-helix transcriptional regulator [Polyangiaceae bacterium]